VDPFKCNYFFNFAAFIGRGTKIPLRMLQIFIFSHLLREIIGDRGRIGIILYTETQHKLKMRQYLLMSDTAVEDSSSFRQRS
jgi:hypothetical protein